MSNPWGGSRVIGSWAAEAEAEEREQAAAAAANKNNTKSNDLQNFPSLRESINAKPKPKRLTLPQFYASGGVSGHSEGLTPAEMLQLPTGPKERGPDDYSGHRIGGGFSNYGRSGPREGDSDSSWGARRSRGGFDDDRRGPPRRGPDYDLQPSRADEASDWGAAKKSMAPSSMDSGRTNRYESLGAGSRADEAESWNFGKKPLSAAPPVRSSTFVSGYRNSGMDSDRWRRGDEERGRDIQSGRPKLVLDPPRGVSAANEPPQPVKANKANPFGAARPREEVLTEKGVDWKKIDMELEVKSTHSSRPSSAHSSRSESAGLGHPGPSTGADAVAKPGPKVNPFGNAKPREVVLQEQGKDWRKMDLELENRAIQRPETEEEKALKTEIKGLKKELEKEPPCDHPQESGVDEASLRNLVELKERELEKLTRELNDKVRLGQKAVERPGSGAGRLGDRPPSRPGSGAGRLGDRPSSRSGSIDDARSVDFMDRPRSRGTGDVWTRPSDDRRGSFHGGRDRGYLGSRNFDRNTSRERW